MRNGKFGLATLVLLTGLCEMGTAAPFFRRSSMPSSPPSFSIPLADLTSRQAEVRQVLQNPTVMARGPAEKFPCQPEQYYYFLNHPDRAVAAWRKLGAKCVSITDQGGGQFGWADDLGSEVQWETVYQGPEGRVWYAHGKVRPAPMLPMVPVAVVLFLHHNETRSDNGTPMIEHHADLFLHTDSKAVNLFTRLMGTSTHHLAEQGLSQLQMFFSALSWYLDQHPERATAWLK